MDRMDREILKRLMQDGRLTNHKLAKDIGMSASATLERVRRLEATGVIQGYHIQVEPVQVDRGLELFMAFTLNNQSQEAVKRFESLIGGMDEVLSCAQVLGRFDFMAHVAVRDVAALSQFVNEKLLPLDCIERVESMTVLHMLKRNYPPLPLEETADDDTRSEV